jgi:hypothetical protein
VFPLESRIKNSDLGPGLHSSLPSMISQCRVVETSIEAFPDVEHVDVKS